MLVFITNLLNYYVPKEPFQHALKNLPDALIKSEYNAPMPDFHFGGIIDMAYPVSHNIELLHFSPIRYNLIIPPKMNAWRLRLGCRIVSLGWGFYK
jgi:hypothetical protein